MKQETVYDRIRNRTKPETQRYVQKNLAVAAEVDRLMKEKGWSQKQLAKKLGKSESEVSKWLSGLHNLTLKSIAKMEAVLEANLLEVPKQAPQQTKPVQYAVWTIEKPFSKQSLTSRDTEEAAKFETPAAFLKIMVA